MRRRDWLVAAASTAGATFHATDSLAVPVAATPFLYGLGLSLNDKPLTRAISLTAELGGNSVRIDVPWSRVESDDGRLSMPAELDAMVDRCVSTGVVPLLILAYGHKRYGGDKPLSTEAVNAFARYAVFVVRHFKGRARLFDVWNEWNTHTGKTKPGSAEDYIRLASAVHRAVKDVDAGAQLLSGGISDLGLGNGWLEKFLSLGGHEWVDGLSIHPYNWFYRHHRTPEAAVALVDDLAAQLDGVGASHMPIYVTEVGWPSFSGRYGRTDAEVESYFTRFMLLTASRPRVAGVWWYCLRDQGQDRNNKEHRFGLLEFDYSRKPIAAQFEHVGALLRKHGRPVQQSVKQGYRLQWPKGTTPPVSWEPSGETAVPLNGLAKPER